jgi:ubiquinone/menaquinone biosynthesis C-methylase UbiE
MALETMIEDTHVVYDQIGHSYDQTRSADPVITASICKLLSPHKAGHYLDIGCGSGNYTIALSKLGYKITGVDISAEMLNKAKAKSDAVTWIKSNAKKLQFDDEEFDGAICTLATHHIQELDKAFSEIYRVLKPKTRSVIFTATPTQMRNYWLCHYFPKMMSDACETMQEQNDMIKCLETAGFSNTITEKFFITNQLTDWFLHSGKYRPEVYLNPAVRAGISTFAKRPNDDPEITAGLRKLQNDINNNTIKNIIAQYENQNGEYLFLSAEKP